MAVCLIHYLNHSDYYIFTLNLCKYCSYCKTNLIEIEFGGVGWISLAQDSGGLF